MIWPVIMPGSATRPVVAMALSIGIMPVRSAERNGPPSASKRGAPSASRASMAARSRLAASLNPSSTSATAVMVLPSTMPRIGSI